MSSVFHIQKITNAPTPEHDDTDIWDDDHDDEIIASSSDPKIGKLALDIYENDAEYRILAPIAGCDPQSIDLQLDDNSLTIIGRRHMVSLPDSYESLVQEIYWGEFSRTILLPGNIDEKRIQASWKENLLTVIIPK